MKFGYVCCSELSSVFPNTAHVNPFFILSSLSPTLGGTLGFGRKISLIDKTSRRSGGKAYVVNTKVTQSFIRPDVSPLGLSHNYTHTNFRVD